jgi:Fis family transcriptional regulator
MQDDMNADVSPNNNEATDRDVDCVEMSILNQHVRSALQSYFAHLDGHGACNLYELVIREVELPLLETVLEHCGHNQTKASKVLGISRSTLRKKLTDHGIDQP